MNLVARFTGVIFSPRDTFQNVAAHPRVLGMLVVICVLSAAVLGVFFNTQVGQDAWVEAATRGREMSDQQYDAIQRMSAFAGYLAIGQAVIGTPLMILIVSGILFAIFNAAMGGNATFRQLFAVVTHAWVIPCVSAFFTMPLSYMRGTLTSATSLGVLLPMFDDKSFVGAFLGTIDFFMIWALIVLAIGLAVLFKRRTQPIAISLLSVYVAIALIVAAVTAG
jgi:hypothetical protein